ncbi:MAG TPA: SWIM zinc finger family protein [Bacteroidia bacterium]|nr:SWIM zinc finger family protein [Bacteroidia bacterium]
MEKVVLSLENFRNEVDEEIIQRGYIYFRNGWVKTPREVMPGYFEYVVHEVNPHAVSFTHNSDGTFTDIFCTCGDRAHLACRHMAAVLVKMEEEWTESQRTPEWEDLEGKA